MSAGLVPLHVLAQREGQQSQSPRGSSVANSLNALGENTVSSHTLTEQETLSLGSWQVVPGREPASPGATSPTQRRRLQDATSSALPPASPGGRPRAGGGGAMQAPGLHWCCSSHETLSQSGRSDLEDDEVEGAPGIYARGGLPSDSMELDAVLRLGLNAFMTPPVDPVVAEAAMAAASLAASFSLAAVAGMGAAASAGSAAGSARNSSARSAGGEAPPPSAASPSAGVAIAAGAGNLKAVVQHPTTAPGATPLSFKGIQQTPTAMMDLADFLGDKNVPAFPFGRRPAPAWGRAGRA